MNKSTIHKLDMGQVKASLPGGCQTATGRWLRNISYFIAGVRSDQVRISIAKFSGSFPRGNKWAMNKGDVAEGLCRREIALTIFRQVGFEFPTILLNLIRSLFGNDGSSPSNILIDGRQSNPGSEICIERNYGKNNS